VLRELVRSFEPYRQSNRLCDLGFGAGTLLEIARQQGWECHGTETSRVALEAGRSRGWNVLHPSELDHAASAPASFDVVTGIEFLEHLPDGGAELERAARLLRPGGLLYLTTPNARSINCRLLGSRWSIVAPPDHRLLWSRAGLYRALRSAGLRPLRARTTGLNPGELLALTRRAGTPAPSSRVEAGYRLNTWVSGSPWRRRAKSAANLLLSALGAGDTLKVWARRPSASCA
jgi:SAM-dependent methyltransferase